MSITAMSAARQITGIQPKEKFVLMALADYANDIGVAWPRIGTLETWTCMSRSSIIRSLNALEERGLIEKYKRTHDNGAQRSNQYRLCFVPVSRFSDAEDFGFDTGGVSTRDGGGVTQTPLELPREQPEELKPLSTSSTSSMKKKNVAEEGQVETLVEIWNAHCGVLPSAKSISPTRRRSLEKLIKRAGWSKAGLLLERATKAVAQDDFWKRNKYGLDNLLAGDKVFQRAESYEAQEAPTSAACSLGDTVRFTSVMGRDEEGEVVEVTDKQVAIRQSRDGRVVRAPLGSIKEVL